MPATLLSALANTAGWVIFTSVSQMEKLRKKSTSILLKVIEPVRDGTETHQEVGPHNLCSFQFLSYRVPWVFDSWSSAPCPWTAHVRDWGDTDHGSDMKQVNLKITGFGGFSGQGELEKQWQMKSR